MNTPKIRFPGFKNSWNNSILGEIVSHKNDFYKPNKKESLKCIELENLNKNTGTINGYFDSNTQKSIKNVFVEGDILYGKLRPYLKKYWYANFNGICSSEIWVIRSISKKLNSKFLYNFIQTDSFTKNINLTSGTKMPRANWNIVKELILHYPSQPEEQQKIGDFFMLLDKRIEQQEQKIALLKDYKKAMMQRIFSQKIRFKDQNGNDYPDWEEKKLGEMIYRSSKKNTDQKYDRIQSISNKYGFVNQEDYFQDRRVGSLNVSNYYVINKGCFAYNPSRIDVGSLAYKHDNDISIISPLYVSFKGNTKHINDKFLLGWLFSHKFVGKLGRLFEGSVRNTLSYENLSTIDIETPCIAEQEKIALFLEVINDSIENQKELLDEIIKEKTALLNRMFI